MIIKIKQDSFVAPTGEDCVVLMKVHPAFCEVIVQADGKPVIDSRVDLHRGQFDALVLNAAAIQSTTKAIRLLGYTGELHVTFEV